MAQDNSLSPIGLFPFKENRNNWQAQHQQLGLSEMKRGFSNQLWRQSQSTQARISSFHGKEVPYILATVVSVKRFGVNRFVTKSFMQAISGRIVTERKKPGKNVLSKHSEKSYNCPHNWYIIILPFSFVNFSTLPDKLTERVRKLRK